MGLSEKQRLILTACATVLVTSMFWWFGLDFAIQSKVAEATQRGENAGYSRAIADGRHSDKYLFEKNVNLEHEIGRLREEISMLMQSPSVEMPSEVSRDSNYTRPPKNRTEQKQVPTDRTSPMMP